MSHARQHTPLHKGSRCRDSRIYIQRNVVQDAHILYDATYIGPLQKIKRGKGLRIPITSNPLYVADGAYSRRSHTQH